MWRSPLKVLLQGRPVSFLEPRSLSRIYFYSVLAIDFGLPLSSSCYNYLSLMRLQTMAKCHRVVLSLWAMHRLFELFCPTHLQMFHLLGVAFFRGCSLWRAQNLLTSSSLEQRFPSSSFFYLTTVSRSSRCDTSFFFRVADFSATR